MKAKYVKESGNYPREKERTKEVLILNESYDVVDVNQDRWRTDIYLSGFGGSFNSVHFEFDDEEEFEKMCKESFIQNYGD